MTMKPAARPAQRILITGATGFIGTRLTDALLNLGYQVTALTRDKARCHARLGTQVEAITWDNMIGSRSFNAVINLAGARIAPLPWTGARRKKLRDSRIAFTERLTQILSQSPNPPAVWVQASAVGYYGASQSDDVMTESDPPSTDFASTLCADWENAANGAVNYGTRLSTLRFGVVLGHGGALPGLLMPMQLGLGGPLGSGTQPFPWIHVDDVIRLIIACIEDDKRSGVYNAVAPDAHTQASFARTACAILGRPYWLPAPALPVRLLGDVSQLFLDGRQVEPRRLIEDGWVWSHASLHSALRHLINEES